MNTVRVASPITIGNGVLLLSLSQVNRRRHAVRAVDKEATAEAPAGYEVLLPVQFKAGEVFGWDQPIPKGWGDSVEVVADKAKTAAPAAAQAKTAAKQ